MNITVFSLGLWCTALLFVCFFAVFTCLFVRMHTLNTLSTEIQYNIWSLPLVSTWQILLLLSLLILLWGIFSPITHVCALDSIEREWCHPYLAGRAIAQSSGRVGVCAAVNGSSKAAGFRATLSSHQLHNIFEVEINLPLCHCLQL